MVILGGGSCVFYISLFFCMVSFEGAISTNLRESAVKIPIFSEEATQNSAGNPDYSMQYSTPWDS